MPLASRSRWGVTTRRSETKVAAEGGDLLELARVWPLEDLVVERFDAFVEAIQDRKEGVGESVEHPVDDELLRSGRLRAHPPTGLFEGAAGARVRGDDVAAAEEGVDLVELDLAAFFADRPVVDEEHVVAEVLQLRSLAAFGQILERERVEGEDLGQRRHLGRAGIGEVEPEVLVALQKAADLVPVDAVEEAHAATLDPPADAVERRIPGLRGRRSCYGPLR